MTPRDVIRQVEESASEWIEMSQDPAALIAGILANKIIKLQDHVDYLQKRLNHDGKYSNSGRN
jgi:hypothetical protein